MADTIPCPACGTDNSPDAVRCHVCDYELRAQLPGPPTGPSKCPRCGSGVAAGASFCQVCGQSVDQRFARPHTGALNVRALFGDQDGVPTRTPIREHTEIAPSARGPVAPAPRFAPPGSQAGSPGPAAASPGLAAPYITASAAPAPTAAAGSFEAAPAAVESAREPSAPRGRRRPAPRPRPNYAGFDAGDSSHGEQRRDQLRDQLREQAPSSYVSSPPQASHAGAGPIYANTPARQGAPPRPQPHAADPAASSNNLPRPRARVEAVAEQLGAREQRPHAQTGRGYDEAAASVQAGQGYGAPAHAWGSPEPSTLIRMVLVGRDGREGESFPLPHAGIEIGRTQAGRNIAFPSDPFISPHHAKVTPMEGGVHLADLGSRNGVYLRLTEPTPVYPGDYFLLGNQLLRLDRLEGPWQEQPLDEHEVRGFGTPVKPPWAALTRVCVGEIDDDRYHLRGTEMTIGREQGEVVFPSDGFLSRAHARVRMEVHENTMNVLLEDLGSANGTYLRIRGAVNVPYGAMFRVGDQIFRVRHD